MLKKIMEGNDEGNEKSLNAVIDEASVLSSKLHAVPAKLVMHAVHHCYMQWLVVHKEYPKENKQNEEN